MKILIACSFGAMALISVACLANPPSGGHGHGNPGFGSVTGASMPPGLKMKNKTPPGWNKGQKKGWHKKHNTHSENFKHNTGKINH